MITLLTRIREGGLVCDKVFSLRLDINPGECADALGTTLVHRLRASGVPGETLPLASQCITLSLFKTDM